MIFKSSEIRWFSYNKESLWNLYQSFPLEGEGTKEPDRTDYYLKSGTVATGIKIREGNHELKVKCGADEDIGYGVIEQWMKWSTPEPKNILNAIEGKWLKNWLAVEKKRFKKRYEIVNSEKLQPAENEFVTEGCGAEFTEIRLSESDLIVYTLGMEAYSPENRAKENIRNVLNQLELEPALLRDLDSCGYPQFLQKIGRNTE